MTKIFTNRDFYLSAFLIASGQKLLSATRTKSITLFSFATSAELIKLVDQYYSMQARVDPMTYGSSIRALKSVIHSSNVDSKDKLTNDNSRI